jgi:hypothetical protein
MKPLPPCELDPTFDDPVIRNRIGEVIAKAVAKRRKPIQGPWLLQVSAMIETRPNRSWYDYNWDWALISLLAVVLIAGIVVLWTYANHPQAAAMPDDATTGQSTRPSVPIFPN